MEDYECECTLSIKYIVNIILVTTVILGLIFAGYNTFMNSKKQYIQPNYV